MDVVIVESVETESLINNVEKEVYTLNNIEIDETTVIPSAEEIMTTSDDVEQTDTLAPDAIFSDPVSVQSLPETGSEDMQNVEQVENTYSEQSTGETSNYNIDDLYALLNSGSLTVKLQSESETEQIQSESESELSISDIISQLEKNRISESECLQVINENIVKSSENEKTLSIMSITILVSILGGMVAIGFLKGLR